MAELVDAVDSKSIFLLVQILLGVFFIIMLTPQIILDVVDNSGVHSVRCIQVKKKKYSSMGTVGSLFVGVVCSVKNQKTKTKKFKKGQLVSGLFLNSKKEVSINMYSTGFYIKHFSNACTLFDAKTFKKNQTFFGSRSQGAVSFLIKQKGFYKAYNIFDFYF